MIQTINISESVAWDKALRQVPVADVYYRRGYVRAFQIIGDGEPVLLEWSQGDVCGVCVLMMRNIEQSAFFEGKIPVGKYFDAVTPYGYGGFVFNKAPSNDDIILLKSELTDLLTKKRLVSVFFRFHPVLKNADALRNIMEVVDLGKTIAMNLESPEVIWANITSKNRNMIRKAEKNGVIIKHGKGLLLLEKFREIYNQTMLDDNAAGYYFFEPNFYESIDRELNDNYEIFYAEYNGQIIAMSIMLYSGQQMHYHLSGSVRAFRHLAPSNLLLYQAALWGYSHGFKTFHLGGGVGSGQDPLYKFKAAFNRNSDYQFSIGKLIVDPDIYARLVEIRKQDPSFDPHSKFFPIYRS